VQRWQAIVLIGALVLAGCQSQPAPPGTTPSNPPPVSGDPGKTVPEQKPPQPMPGDFALASIDMVDEQIGWGFMVGQFGLVRTTDGGETWRNVTPPELQGKVDADLAPLSPDNAWLVVTHRVPLAGAYPTVEAFYTADGGKRWARSEFVTPNQSLYGSSIHFLNEQHGFVLVEPEHGMSSAPGLLYRTEDGGRNWRLAAGADLMPFSGIVRFATEQTGWVVGHRVSTTPDELAFTTDGGQTWRVEEPLPLPGDFPPGKMSVLEPPVEFGGRLVLPALFWPESHQASAMRTVLYTAPRPGEPWTPLTHLPYGLLELRSDGHGWLWTGEPLNPGANSPVAGAFRVTSDGGQTWTEQKPDANLQALLDKGYNIQQLSFVSARTGWALLGSPGPMPPRLARTTDGGQHWTILNVNP
jgi:photosystem II stability/assembly factor-like uncharacterized protein